MRFHAPDVGAATDVELLIEATDQTGLSTSFARGRHGQSGFGLGQSSSPCRVAPRSDGLHWVITGDGFTADQQQDLLRAAVAMAKSVTEAPELALHARVLNVHVLTAVSRGQRRGLAGTRGHRTAFNAALGCSGVERVACVNWDRVYMALLAERVPFDAVGVVLNTDVYVGSASAPGSSFRDIRLRLRSRCMKWVTCSRDLATSTWMRTSRAISAADIAKDRFPNVTTISDPSRIPWRHWFTDPARIPAAPGEAGVGRFEGAFYSAMVSIVRSTTAS